MQRFLARLGGALVLTLLVASCDGGGGSSQSVPPTTEQGASIVSAPECDAAREVAAVLAGADLTNPDGIAGLPAVVRQLHDVVPEELAPDVDTLAESMDAFVAILSRFEFDTAAVEADAQAQAELAELDTPAVAEATARLQQWIDEACA
ncbi:MAG: hypothetical protein RI900_196 [Actinomycetota bacterium]